MNSACSTLTHLLVSTIGGASIICQRSQMWSNAIKLPTGSQQEAEPEREGRGSWACTLGRSRPGRVTPQRCWERHGSDSRGYWTTTRRRNRERPSTAAARSPAGGRSRWPQSAVLPQMLRTFTTHSVFKSPEHPRRTLVNQLLELLPWGRSFRTIMEKQTTAFTPELHPGSVRVLPVGACAVTVSNTNVFILLLFVSSLGCTLCHLVHITL